MDKTMKKIRRSARKEKCRWPTPDEDGYCRYCGWRLITVSQHMKVAGIVRESFRHRYPRSYQHKQHPKLTLSALGPAGTLHSCSDTCEIVGTHNLSNRLRVPLSREDLAAWKASVRCAS